MKKLKVYIASPYTQGDHAENVAWQMKMGNDLMDRGFIPLIPTLSHYQDSGYHRSYEDWMEYLVGACDAVLRLVGFSPGADREVQFALDRGIPVFFSIEALLAWQQKKRSEDAAMDEGDDPRLEERLEGGM